MTDAVRIAVWSGPRNISTAMMRAFGNRPDTAVIDEPFYAAFLALSGLDHPMREAVLASQPTDPARVAEVLLGPVPAGRPIFYQKHMTHHMLPAIDRRWMAGCRHAFLIRSPERVLASYAAKRADVTLEDIGFVQQATLFDEVADHLGRVPPVLDAEDVCADPRAALAALCHALKIPFDQRMLSWPAGARDTDGVWAPIWYGAVERSTGFVQSTREASPLEGNLRRIADQADPHYARLRRFKLLSG